MPPTLMPLADRHWIILKFRYVGPFLEVQYRDSSGERIESRTRSLDDNDVVQVVDALNLPFRVAALTGANTLPVFIQWASDQWSRSQMEEALFRLAGSRGSGNFEFVLLSGGRGLRRPPFVLPFRIIAVGSRASEAVDLLRSHSWFQQRGFDLLGISVTISSDAGLSRTLRKQAGAIVVVDSLETALEACRELPAEALPRLIISLSGEPALAAALPRRVSSLAVRTPFASAVVESFFFALIHDQPLHMAAREVRFQHALTHGDLVLATDPLGNHGLRLFDAFLSLQHEVERVKERLNAAVRAGQRFGFVPLLSEPKALDLLNSLALPNFGFSRETTGFVPMTALTLALRTAHRLMERMERRPLPRLESVALESDARIVNITMRRLETEPLLEVVSRGLGLAGGAAYEMRVNIGDREAESLVEGEQPPIGPLLPPSPDGGHLLDVVIQGKDFQLLSKRSSALRLPQAGPSETIYFRVRAPHTSGPARLRVCLYYRNHLVQSYLVTAQVGPSEMPWESAGSLSAGVEYSRDKELPWNLEEVGERLTSIGVNEGAKSHELIVKGTGKSGELALPDGAIATARENMRKTLDKMVAAADGSERVFPGVAPGRQPAEDVAVTYRSLMECGRQLYLAMFGAASKNEELRGELLSIARSKDQKIQIVRFDDRFVLPWALLYDFVLPEPPMGSAPLPVCLGRTLDDNGATVACGHTKDDEVYCIRGFWGIRHLVEEMLVQGVGKASKVARNGVTNPLRLVAGSNIPEGLALKEELKGVDNTIASGPSMAKDLLELLWRTPPARPAILVLLGHLEERALNNEPSGPRVVLGNSEWLTLNRLSAIVANNLGWRQARPIIMQMTCDSANVDQRTLNHFLLQWNTAGAAAIIGTEARVGAGLAAKCAASLVRDLWAGAELGMAITEFRRSLVGAGNPLGFLFTAYGDVDLTLI